MAPSALRRMLLGLIGLGLAMETASLMLTFHTRSAHPGVPIYDYLVEGAIGGLGLVALSLLLALRRPEHSVTWALVGAEIFAAIQVLLGSYAVEALVAGHGGLPYGRVALAVSSVAQTWFVLGFMLMINLFPTGRSLGGRWRIIVWSLLPLALFGTLSTLTSPMEVGFLGLPPLLDSDLKQVMDGANLLLTVLFLGGTIIHVVTRFLRSSGVERQQLKWFAFSLVMGIVVLAIPWSESDTVGTVLWTLVPLSILGSIALAILRYRLFEIDRIISRTVSYGLVIGLLGLLVLGLVSLFAVFLPSDDPLVVAVSTLAAAALFNPLRRRVQSVVDRRFNRSRYDAGRTIDKFAETLRDEVDPNGVVAGWLAVVETTMHPASSGVWVKSR